MEAVGHVVPERPSGQSRAFRATSCQNLWFTCVLSTTRICGRGRRVSPPRSQTTPRSAFEAWQSEVPQPMVDTLSTRYLGAHHPSRLQVQRNVGPPLVNSLDLSFLLVSVPGSPAFLTSRGISSRTFVNRHDLTKPFTLKRHRHVLSADDSAEANQPL